MLEQTVLVTIDEVTFQLKKRHDFRWLEDLGTLFAVFDKQDSGNLCFGVDTGDNKIFVKYAGARTIGFTGTPADAVMRLKSGLPLYEALRHDSLINLIQHYEVNEGYVGVFEWFDGESLYASAFAGRDKYNHPDSPFFRYKNLPVAQRLKSLDSIFSFHRFVESEGYAAVDFYDGSILYDFKNDCTRICDIDYYRKKPTFNDIGQDFWGSKRFKSPEEYELHAPIDERTNVFHMGAAAFVLLGGALDRGYSHWEAGEELYQVALRAVEEDRAKRYSSVEQFCEAWNTAKNSTIDWLKYGR